jgi:hypothetical protein
LVVAIVAYMFCCIPLLCHLLLRGATIVLDLKSNLAAPEGVTASQAALVTTQRLLALIEGDGNTLFLQLWAVIQSIVDG